MRMLIVAASAFLLVGAAFAQNPQDQHLQMQERIDTVTCRVGNVGVFNNRVHIRCSGAAQAAVAAAGSIAGAIQGMAGQAGGNAPAPSAPAYFAVGMQADPALANNTLELATAAAAQNKQVQIFYNAAAHVNPPGCQPNDCRRLIGIVMLVQN